MFKRSPVQRLGVDEIGRTHRHEQVRKVSGQSALDGPVSRQEWPWYCGLAVTLTGTNASVDQGRVFMMTCAAPRI